MSALTYTQEFFLCAVSGKGNIPAISGGEAATSLIIGGITELLSQGYIGLNEKEKLIVGKEWDNGLPHLSPLYEKVISMKKPVSIADFVVSVYNPKQINELILAVGASLAAAGFLDEIITQIRTRKNYRYVPKEQVVKNIIERIRAGFLGDEAPNDDTVCLTALLDNGGFIHDYFARDEAESVRKRLNEINKCGSCAAVKEIIDIHEACTVVIMGVGR